MEVSLFTDEQLQEQLKELVRNLTIQKRTTTNPHGVFGSEEKDIHRWTGHALAVLRL